MAAAAARYPNPRCTVTERETMTTAEAIADPQKFVEGMSEQTTYCLFVRIPPFTLRALLGPGPEQIEPFVYGGVSGSMVTVEDGARWERLSKRFPPEAKREEE